MNSVSERKGTAQESHQKQGEEGKANSELLGDIYFHIPENFSETRISNINIFLINERDFGESRDKSGTISARNIKSMIVRS